MMSIILVPWLWLVVMRGGIVMVSNVCFSWNKRHMVVNVMLIIMVTVIYEFDIMVRNLMSDNLMMNWMNNMVINGMDVMVLNIEMLMINWMANLMMVVIKWMSIMVNIIVYIMVIVVSIIVMIIVNVVVNILHIMMIMLRIMELTKLILELLPL